MSFFVFVYSARRIPIKLVCGECDISTFYNQDIETQEAMVCSDQGFIQRKELLLKYLNLTSQMKVNLFNLFLHIKFSHIKTTIKPHQQRTFCYRKRVPKRDGHCMVCEKMDGNRGKDEQNNEGRLVDGRIFSECFKTERLTDVDICRDFLFEYHQAVVPFC